MAIYDPTTGGSVDEEDLAAVITCYQNVEEQLKDLSIAKRRCATIIAARVANQSKTEYVPFGDRKIRVVHPTSEWSPAQLQAVHDRWGEKAEKYIRRKVEFKPLLKEINQVRRSTGDPDFNLMRDSILQAEMPGQGTPKIEVVE